MKGGIWPEKTHECKELISKLCSPSYTDRITVKTALEHPWLGGKADSENSLDMTDFNKFWSLYKLKQCLTGYFESRINAPKIVERLNEKFKKLEAEKMGNIKKNDFLEGYV